MYIFLGLSVFVIICKLLITSESAAIPKTDCFNLTFFTDENFTGCGRVTIGLCENSIEKPNRPIPDQNFSSLIVEHKKETKDICIVLFADDLCRGTDNSTRLTVTNKSVPKFGHMNDRVKCARICNTADRENIISKNK